MQQNELILELLGQQSDIVDDNVTTVKTNKNTGFSVQFPLQSIAELQQLEDEINVDNQQEIVRLTTSVFIYFFK